MIDINPTKSIITLNVNSLNVPIKRHCQNESKNQTQLYVVYKKCALNIDTYRLKVC